MSSEPQNSREGPTTSGPTTSGPAKTGPRAGRKLALLIILGLAVWGGYVAFGTFLYSPAGNSTGVARGPLKAVIVVTCVVAFLILWALVLLRPQASRGPRSSAARAAELVGWSGSGVASVVVQLLAFGPWLAWHLGWPQATSRELLALFGASLMGAGSGLVLALVSLSNPTARRGRLLGLVSMLLAGVLVVSWLLVRPG